MNTYNGEISENKWYTKYSFFNGVYGWKRLWKFMKERRLTILFRNFWKDVYLCFLKILEPYSKELILLKDFVAFQKLKCLFKHGSLIRHLKGISGLYYFVLRRKLLLIPILWVLKFMNKLWIQLLMLNYEWKYSCN